VGKETTKIREHRQPLEVMGRTMSLLTYPEQSLWLVIFKISKFSIFN
jgi:hypothetical protein